MIYQSVVRDLWLRVFLKSRILKIKFLVKNERNLLIISTQREYRRACYATAAVASDVGANVADLAGQQFRPDDLQMWRASTETASYRCISASGPRSYSCRAETAFGPRSWKKPSRCRTGPGRTGSECLREETDSDLTSDSDRFTLIMWQKMMSSNSKSFHLWGQRRRLWELFSQISPRWDARCLAQRAKRQI